MEINKDNDNIDLSRGVKDDNLSRAGIGLWIMEKRKFLIVTLIAILGGVSLFLYSYFFYNLFDYIRYSKDYERMLQELSLSGSNLGTSRQAEPLEILDQKMFYHNESYDFLIKIKNPNSNFFGNVRYCFFEGDIEIICSTARINPREDRYFLILSTKLEGRYTNQRARIDSVSWERLDVKSYPDWGSYYNERVNFIFSDVKYERSSVSSGDLNNLSFNVKNETPYNYWNVPFSIILFSKGSVVGVNRHSSLNFLSGELRSVSITWPNSVYSVDKVEIYPDLDVLDQNNYMPYR